MYTLTQERTEQLINTLMLEHGLGIDTITRLVEMPAVKTEHTHGDNVICMVCRECDHSQKTGCADCWYR